MLSNINIYDTINRLKPKGVNLKYNVLSVVTVVVIGLLFTGCKSVHVEVKNSGFFKDYKKLDLSKKNDAYKYKDIMVTPVVVISAIPESKQTQSQKKLYKKISEYVTSEYKKFLSSNSMYNLVEKETDNTLRFESAISAVEVNFNHGDWNSLTPIALARNTVTFNSYQRGSVRILGESRLVDAWSKEVMGRDMKVQKDIVVTFSGDNLEFSDLKPALDSWIGSSKIYLNN